jgi:hypothetical protein
MEFDLIFPQNINFGKCRICDWKTVIIDQSNIKELQNHYSFYHPVKLVNFQHAKDKIFLQDVNAILPSKFK